MSKLKKCLYLINLLERRGAMSLKEINECFRHSNLYDGEILPRTFARYKEYIAETFPCYVEFNARTGKYELVRDGELDGEAEALYNYLLSAYHIEGMSELALKHRDKIMLMDAPNGVENVQMVLEAIDQKKGLECDYWSYNKKSKKHLTIIPYFLRTWEQRWYLVAEPLNHHHGQSVFALERMYSMWLTEEKMLPSKNIHVEEYFEGCFGINHSDEPKPERIRIKVYDTQVEYVRALPIHESQREVETTKEWSLFEYRVEPCYNFYQQLLWHREKLEVVEPQHVRDEMRGIVEKMLKAYS
ncbi:MAG: WYL domain-containing protein [Bacteroidaceae bacterium]|nr:WYL domain-containing protein [Bacteroidaceae bacterium]